MQFTLKQLEIFTAIVTYGSTVAAAKALNISQPAVSSALAELESNLDTQLFDRWKRSIVLNDNGRMLLPRAQVMLANARELEYSVSGRKGEISGVLRLGASSTLSSYVIPATLCSFLDQSPDVRVELCSHNKTDIISRMEDCTLDLGVIAGVCNRPNVASLPWLTDELCVFASPLHPLAGKSSVTPADLSECRWVLREEGSGTLEVFLNALPSEIKPLKAIVECNNIESIKRVVEQGKAIGCVAYSAIKREVSSGNLTIIPTPFLDLKRDYYILIHQQRRQSLLLNSFIKCFTTDQNQ